MVYDANGFNYQGNSVIEFYNTTYAGSIPNEKFNSNFQKQNVDIVNLISPAIISSAGGILTDNVTGSAYTGFPDKQTPITFDQAFSKKNIYLTPGIKASISSEQGFWFDGTDMVVRMTDNGNITLSWPQFSTTGSAKVNYTIPITKTIEFLFCAGGGAGGSGGTALGVHGHAEGPSGGGGGTVMTAKYTVSSNKYFTLIIGSGGTIGNTSNFNGNNGGSTSITSAPNTSVTVFGGQGGKFNPSHPSNPGGSTSGGSAWSTDINASDAANNLTGDGYSNSFVSTGDGALTDISIYRNKGGSDTGYGWGAGGGGGAGGSGGNHGGAYNRKGGSGGASVSLWSKSFGGGGPGGGENSNNPDAVTGSKATNADVIGFGVGGAGNTKGWGDPGMSGCFCIKLTGGGWTLV